MLKLVLAFPSCPEVLIDIFLPYVMDGGLLELAYGGNSITRMTVPSEELCFWLSFEVPWLSYGVDCPCLSHIHRVGSDVSDR